MLTVLATNLPATEWDSPLVIITKLAVVLSFVLLNGFFVASEFAIVKVRASQLVALANAGEKRAKLARHVTSHLDAYLSATQLGITLASLALGWLGEEYLSALVEPVFFHFNVTSSTLIHTVSFTVAFTAITFLHIVLGELAPKSLAIQRPLPTTLWTSRPLDLFYLVFRPAIAVLNGAANWLLRRVLGIEPAGEHELAHTEEELRLLLMQSGKARQISARGSVISARALELNQITARDITTPRGDVVFLDIEEPFAENLSRARKSGHTRFPLCRGHLDRAFGLVHVKDLMGLIDDAESDLNKIKRELLSVPEMMSLEKLLELFQNRHAHLALVLDEYGGAIGIVTLDNIIEELVGEIQDEFDAEEPSVQRVSEKEFIIRGGASLYDVRNLTGIDLENEDVSTIGGYVTAVLGRIPHAGDSVRIGDYVVSVTNADGRRVRELRVQKRP